MGVGVGLEIMRKRWRHLGMLAAGMLAAGLLAGPVQAWRHARAAEQTLLTGSPAQKQSALRDLARLGSGRADAVLREALTGSDTEVRRQAACAVGTIRRVDMAEDVRAAWMREPDDLSRSVILFQWALVTGPEAELLLRSMLASQDPWTVLGAAQGLLRRGYVEAAEPLLAMAGGLEEGLRFKAQEELQTLAVPMGIMVGQRVEISVLQPGQWSAGQVAAFGGWWHRNVTPRLLRDYLAWRNHKPDDWRKADQLLHEWKGRSGGFLRGSGQDDKG